MKFYIPKIYIVKHYIVKPNTVKLFILWTIYIVKLAKLVFRQNTPHRLRPLYCQGNLAGEANWLKTKTDWEMSGWKRKRKRTSKAWNLTHQGVFNSRRPQCRNLKSRPIKDVLITTFKKQAGWQNPSQMVLDYLNRGHFVKLPPDKPVLWTRWHFVKHLINQSYETRCSARPPNAKTNSESAESLPLLLFFHWMILSKRYYLAHTLFFRFDIVLGGDFSHMCDIGINIVISPNKTCGAIKLAFICVNIFQVLTIE